MPTALGELDLKLSSEGSVRLAALDAWGRTLDVTAQAYAGEVQRAAGEILGGVKKCQEWWRLVYDEALAGRAAEVHAGRERFLRMLEDWHRLLTDARARVRHAGEVARRDLPEAAQLESEAAALEKTLKKLRSRWQTAEDLEDLAAESLAPSAETIKAIRQKYGYPQAWYDDDSKPF